ncbi:death-associated protein kinase 2-like [Electrophorus electricus]|uniref:Protein kinase domain-containing protein n=1 Tax=Electrophorus electricus TaxID=8005 RepID=A0A4W4HQN2_ELEEL|nr:death-associated protein kinase 2-like [Electrophorus electricus]XP_026874909.2 death-associated protein kinase 2-like [Electrophorus electricus]
MAHFRLQNVEDFYEIGEVLGSGHFGQVRELTEQSSGTLWAGKFLKLQRSASSRLGVERRSVEREVEILQALPHAHIMALHDVFDSRAEIVLVVELISGGELFDFIAEKENLMENEAIGFLKQILSGVAFMHSKQIAHFDLKPENIMLSDKSAELPEIKIIDFGLAQRFTPGEEYRSLCGTPQYIAPEVVNYEPLTVASDMWSMGVITYILLSGMSPFQGDSDEETLRNIVDMKYEFEDQYFSATSDMAKDFIQKLLIKDQSERMTAEECLMHPWIKPLTHRQAASRSRSSINMKNFKKFNARRKWRMSYNMVWVCNRLCRLQLLCKQAQEDEELRSCESDQEDIAIKPASLIRRRLSSNS